ncbi:MAG: mechanosensitive ion channel family protein [Anaerolineae bacterium]|nr:mechanosensitive ion channel family protein [Anaerolineae bacterium]MCO5188877.1 mechanosensitive ion channel family protein [Anaerolineae bacterium]MCO5196041.1 mechanosensitive ion channel family protein [Anaerolineae bacterium]MCO5198616.1 mechanosensitive ion channel family protein [Anaerolineae bacterium]MCO5207963.1 mechanosensitive ion channel family protein [Anaerolineae bacterium]
MADLSQAIWSNELYRKLILTIIIVLGQSLLSRLLIWIATNKIPEDSPHIYTIRKAISYSVTILAALLIFGIWVEGLSDLSVALGILAAGLAFALQEVIGSFAGWLTIISGRPFSVGDRIETSDIRGDVVDVSILRTTLMEIGNWLQGDHNTGRIVTVSNAFIFKEPLYNYSAYLRFIWDEISVPVTYESDWQQAIVIMLETVRSHPSFQDLQPQADEQRRLARRKLAVKITSLEPRVFVKLTDNWIELGMVYPVDNDLRRTFRSEISQQILSQFAAANITIASQTVAITRFPTNKGLTDA